MTCTDCLTRHRSTLRAGVGLVLLPLAAALLAVAVFLVASLRLAHDDAAAAARRRPAVTPNARHAVAATDQRAIETCAWRAGVLGASALLLGAVANRPPRPRAARLAPVFRTPWCARCGEPTG